MIISSNISDVTLKIVIQGRGLVVRSISLVYLIADKPEANNEKYR